MIRDSVSHVLLRLCLLISLLWMPLSVEHASGASETHFIMRTQPGADVQGLLDRHGLELMRSIDRVTAAVNLVRATAPVDPQALQDALANEAGVANFEPLRDVTIPEISLDATLSQSTAAILDLLQDKTQIDYFGASVWTGYAGQTAVGQIRLPEAHQEIATGAGVVAVIDTGVDPTHPVLQGATVPGYDFVHESPGASEWVDLDQSTTAILDQSTAAILDGSTAVLNQSTTAILDQSTTSLLDAVTLPPAFGHGTMVAGVVHLTAPTAQIMPLKAFRSDGTSNTFDIVRAIYYAVDNGAQVINMSFSLPEKSNELDHAVRFATDSGVVCVGSAGNTGLDVRVYPAAFKTVMGVASTDDADMLSTFSNYGAKTVFLAAPGESIITIYPGGWYAGAWGTSFSTPLVAGAAALVLQIDPETDYQGTANALGHAIEGAAELGAGRLDVYFALTRRLRSGGLE